MNLLFWISFALLAYAAFGYAVWLGVEALLRPRPIAREAITPTVSIVIAAHNEEPNLPGKLKNLRSLRYPAERLQMIVVSDGSTDGTAEILRQQGETLVPVILDEPRGKAWALNEAVQRATGEILFFQDARQTVDPDALAELVSCFADPAVGAVSGELLLETADGKPSPEGLGIYWTMEKVVRKLESATGSVVGVTGAIYAVRRELYTEMPMGTILDDVYVPMHVARLGRRVVFQPSAIARDRIFSQAGKEFKRKVRTLTGNYQLLRLAPWMLTPANPLLFRLVSHKLLRLVLPILAAVMLASPAACPEPFYRGIFWSQIVFYGLAVLGMASPQARRFRPAAAANAFVMLNVAAIVAFYNFIRGRSNVWV
jgi:poly-beta-1,6-N-acetyl-D-glucosamine synthase